MKNELLVLVFVCGWTLVGECSSFQELYWFQYDGKVAHLWNSKTKKAVWTRQMSGLDEITWSNDHRAFVVEGNMPHVSQGCVLVWREGFRLREFADLGDYSMGCLWSPDKRYLLVRYGISGDTDVDVGDLYCLNLKPWPRYRYYKLGVAYKMKWNNQRTVTYWDRDFDAKSPHDLINQRVWHVPPKRFKTGARFRRRRSSRGRPHGFQGPRPRSRRIGFSGSANR